MFRSALVTGGASGIGAALVELLEAEGTEVQSLDIATGFDVSDPAAWESIRPVDAAFLNAGVAGGGDSLEAYRRLMAVNVDGVYLGVRRMAEVMEPGGAIVATASLAGLVAIPIDPIYGLTKHAVVGYIRSVAPMLAGQGIRANLVCPGFADTPILSDETREWVAAQGIPLLSATDVARAALVAARSEGSGEAWVVQPGRQPLRYEFRGVPGPR